jgi:hypothetical protein
MVELGTQDAYLPSGHKDERQVTQHAKHDPMPIHIGLYMHQRARAHTHTHAQGSGLVYFLGTIGKIFRMENTP